MPRHYGPEQRSTLGAHDFGCPCPLLLPARSPRNSRHGCCWFWRSWRRPWPTCPAVSSSSSARLPTSSSPSRAASLRRTWPSSRSMRAACMPWACGRGRATCTRRLSIVSSRPARGASPSTSISARRPRPKPTRIWNGHSRRPTARSSSRRTSNCSAVAKARAWSTRCRCRGSPDMRLPPRPTLSPTPTGSSDGCRCAIDGAIASFLRSRPIWRTPRPGPPKPSGSISPSTRSPFRGFPSAMRWPAASTRKRSTARPSSSARPR